MILSNGLPILGSQIDTIGDSTPILANASYYSNNSLGLLGMWAAYGALYKTQLWVSIVIRKLANGTARIPLDLKHQEDNSNQSAASGPLVDLLQEPNPRLSGWRLWQWTSSTFDTYGEAFWLKLRDANGRVRELHPMHPTNVIVRRDEITGELFYLYSAGVRNVTLLPPIPAADVVAFINYNPDNLVRGVSNLESLRMTLLNEDASRRATASFWKNGARPGVVLEHPAELSDGAQKRIQAAWNENHAGADVMGGTAILEEGMKANIIQLSAVEMQYIESRKLNREEVCAAYDVPPPVVHILDNATYSNITEQMRSMYRDTMAPRFVMFESVINHQLVPDFYNTADAVFSQFNMDDVMRGDFETRATAVATLVQNAILKPAEGRPMFGLDDAGPESHKLYGNAALVPLGTAPRGATSTTGEPMPIPLEPDDPGLVPTKAVDVRAVARQLGRLPSIEAKRTALVAEHERLITLGLDPTAMTLALKALGELTAKTLGTAPGGVQADWPVIASTIGTALAQGAAADALAATVVNALAPQPS